MDGATNFFSLMILLVSICLAGVVPISFKYANTSENYLDCSSLYHITSAFSLRSAPISSELKV